MGMGNPYINGGFKMGNIVEFPLSCLITGGYGDFFKKDLWIVPFLVLGIATNKESIRRISFFKL